MMTPARRRLAATIACVAPLLLLGQFGVHQRIAPELSYPWQVDAADLDADGDQDVLAAISMDNRFVWFANDGSGAFGPAQSMLENAAYAKFLASADMDGDGDPDVVAGYGTDAVFVWLENDGTGIFLNSHVIYSTNGDPWALDLADLDADGDLDVVTSGFGGSLRWHENTGQGITWAEHLIGTDVGAADVSIGDLNGDDSPDLLLAATGTVGAVRWCANDGAGGFGPLQNISAGTNNGIEVEAADLDNDGDLDAAYITNWNHTLGWIENIGGAFAAPVEVNNSISMVTGLAVDDTNGDGWRDLVVTVQWNNSVRIYPNIAGTFGSPTMVTTDPNSPIGVVLKDFDGDTDTDVLYCSAGDSRIAWCAQLSPGVFAPEVDLARAVDYPMSMQTADMDQDGDQDVLTNSWTDGDLFWFPNDGSGNMNEVRHFGQGLVSSTAPRVDDLDQDGDPDVSVAYYAGTVGWYTNDGNGEFAPLQVVSTADTTIRAFTTSDLDGDGSSDLITGSELDPGKICWYANAGGGFGAQQVVESGSVFTAVVGGDLDGDGDNDLLASAAPDQLFRYINDGSGNFGPRITIADSINQCRFITIVDVDGDTDNDIIAVRQRIVVFDGGGPIDTLPSVIWYANDGVGNFGAEQGIADFATSTTMHVMDIDGDGDPDLLLSYIGPEGKVSCWRNNGAGQYDEIGAIPAPFISNYAVGSGDLNGDGDPDFLLCETQYDRIGWNENYFGSPFRIEGSVFLDLNGDGNYGEGDTTGAFLSVSTTPLLASAFTDLSGTYTFWVDSGQYDVMSTSPGPLWLLSTGQATYQVDLTSADPVADGLVFGFTPVADTTLMETTLIAGTGVCGGHIPMWMNCTNLGTRIEQGYLQLDLDPLYTFVSAVPPPDSIVGQRYYWSFDSLFYFGSVDVRLVVEQPSATFAGTTLTSLLTMHRTDANGSVTAAFTDQVDVVLPCAMDPNDKQVDPKGYGIHGALPIEQESLTYTIRFQNTGTANAENVMVRDQLSIHLDPSSVHLMTASHLVTRSGVEADGELVIRFDGIMLPDSGADLLGSQGFVVLRVQPRPSLASGTVIENSAAIHFDFNDAVITNTVLNTLVNCDLHEATIADQGAGDLHASAGANYQWYLGGLPLPGDTLPTLQATAHGDYTVQVTSVYGCADASDPYAFIGTGVASIGGTALRVSPNPVGSQLVLWSSSALTAAHQITLFDAQGRSVITVIGNGGQRMVIQRGALASGAYMLRIAGGDGVENVKVILD